MIKNIADLRQDYSAATLDIADTQANPIDQFAIWFEEAQKAEVKEPNAFTLSTINAQGRPRGRVVLLKGFDMEGFVFYTNYNKILMKMVSFFLPITTVPKRRNCWRIPMRQLPFCGMTWSARCALKGQLRK